MGSEILFAKKAKNTIRAIQFGQTKNPFLEELLKVFGLVCHKKEH
jgi:hypothetical protein